MARVRRQYKRGPRARQDFSGAGGTHSGRRLSCIGQPGGETHTTCRSESEFRVVDPMCRPCNHAPVDTACGRYAAPSHAVHARLTLPWVSSPRHGRRTQRMAHVLREVVHVRGCVLHEHIQRTSPVASSHT